MRANALQVADPIGNAALTGSKLGARCHFGARRRRGNPLTMGRPRDAVLRRAVLGGGAAFAAAVLSGLRARADLPGDPDVIVIGAGAAGIGASQKLTALGISHIVIEAADRIGGRALTDATTFGVPFDIGCAWIHAADRNPFYRLARQANYHLHCHDLDLNRIYYGRKHASEASLKEEEEAEKAIHSRVETLADEALVGNGIDIPTGETIPKWTLPFEAAATYLGPMDMAVDLGDLSSLDYAQSADLDPNYLVQEGFGTLVAKTGLGIPVRLSTPARIIHYGAGKGVAIETDSGTIEARAAILTVSTGVLASGAIRFRPGLPEWKETAVGEVPMGLLAKIPLLVRGDRFGVQPYENILVQYPGIQEIYFLAWPFETDLMVGFVGGEFAWELSAAGEQAAIDFAKQRLGQTFGADAPKRVTKALLTDWASNPLTRGAYSAALPGHAAERVELARPLADRLFFAGEALAGPFVQTCGGAYVSGLEVAEDVGAILAGRKPKPRARDRALDEGHKCLAEAALH
jgi:monoamine oxidase